MRRFIAAAAVTGLALAGAVATTPQALAQHDNNGKHKGWDNGKPQSRLAKLVEIDELREHQRAFQTIAKYNDGNRAAGTDGGVISARYIVNQLERAGYDPTVQKFEFQYFELVDVTFEQVAPEQVTYTAGEDFITMQYSGSGDVTAMTEPVDTQSGNSGCQASDFEGYPEGEIALIRRGACTFAKKAANAAEAGAPAVVIYNEGNTPDRMGAINGTLGRPFDIPVVGASYQLGKKLVNLADEGLELHLATETINEKRTARNVIAETDRGRDNNVVVAGAHFDSVPAGPGINDNTSGTAAILEMAQQIRHVKHVNNKVRFTFWGAEEFGLLGSQYYVDHLSQQQLDDIALYLNYDMLGSPNFVRFIYDGDNSSGTGFQGPPGSGAIEQIYKEYFQNRGLETAPTPFNGRSDYGPFIAEGIPAGGLFSGAEGIKSEKEARIYGGTAGKQYDPCYHEACDDFDNIDLKGYSQLADGAAYAVERFARSTLPVNGVANTFSTYNAPQPDRVGDHWIR